MSKIKQQSTIKDMILATISGQIDQQNEKGMRKYGQTLDDCAVEDYEWLKMANEELVDACNYFVKEIERLQGLLVHFRTSTKDATRHVINGNDETPREALDAAVEEYKAVSERDEIIEDLQDEINGLKAEIVELEGNRDEWCQVSSDAAGEIVRLRALLVRAWEG